MNLECLEKKYKYLKKKDRLIRDAYGTRLNHIGIIATPSKLHQDFLKTQTEFSLRRTWIKSVSNAEYLEHDMPKDMTIKLIDKELKRLEEIRTTLNSAQLSAELTTGLTAWRKASRSDEAKEVVKKPQTSERKVKERLIEDRVEVRPLTVRDSKFRIGMKDIQRVIQIVEKMNVEKEVPEVNIEVRVEVPEELKYYAEPYFMYSTKIVTNPILLQNEYERDDFYFLQFPIPPFFQGNHISLTLTELNSKHYPSITLQHMKTINRLLVINSVIEHCFNPKKRLSWIRNLKDIIGNLYKIELVEGKASIGRYLCFDYFSYKNYIMNLIEISYHQRLVKKQFKKPTIEALGNVFINLNKEKTLLSKIGAFRNVLHRLKHRNEGKEILSPKPLLSIKYG